MPSFQRFNAETESVPCSFRVVRVQYNSKFHFPPPRFTSRCQLFPLRLFQPATRLPLLFLGKTLKALTASFRRFLLSRFLQRRLPCKACKGLQVRPCPRTRSRASQSKSRLSSRVLA